MSLPRARFAARLAERPLLADGGTGTLLFSRGIPQRACLDELPATRPELVGTIHREYLEAGADLIETLTFGANRIRLDGFGLAAQAGRLNRRAAQLAREARDVSGRDAWVGGSIGPLGPPTREMRHLGEAVIRAAYREQIEGLLEGGADVLVIETFFDLAHLLLAVDEAHRAADIPVIASLTFGEDLALSDGTTPAAAAAALVRAGVEAIGVNCGSGPLACIDALEGFGPAAAADPARSIMPNAGLPQRLEGRFVYAAEPAYLGRIVPRLLDAGARIIGGCCGTTPDHIAAMRAALDAVVARHRRRQRPVRGRRRGRRAHARDRHPGAPDRRPRRNPRTSDRSARVTARPIPRGPALRHLRRDRPAAQHPDRPHLDAARLLQDAGTDTVNISDSAMARVRMGAMAVAFGIQNALDLECVVHVTTRDRNLMALESELLGRPRAGRDEHPRAHRRPAARRRLPNRHRRLGRGLHRLDRDTVAPQSGRGPGWLPHRPAGVVHDRRGAGSHRPRCGHGVGPPGTQAGRRARTLS